MFNLNTLTVLMEPSGIEPADLLRAKQALSQLS